MYIGPNLNGTIDELRLAVEKRAGRTHPAASEEAAGAERYTADHRLMAAVLVWPMLLRIEALAGVPLDEPADAAARLPVIERLAVAGTQTAWPLGEGGIALRNAVEQLLEAFADPMHTVLTVQSPEVRRLREAAASLDRLCPMAGLQDPAHHLPEAQTEDSAHA